MPRYFIELSYNGANYFGWQRQPESISVQEVIEENISKLYSNEPMQIVGCGRTDTGVHASNYYAHIDLPDVIEEDSIVFKLNRMLPDCIAIQRIIKVQSNSHARFDAAERTYRYFIHSKKDPFKANSWYFPQHLDFSAMNKAAELLIGKKDFTSLSKLHTDVKTNICDVRKAIWKEEKDSAYFEITADRFLRNMVRATVGTLTDVGLGKIKPNDIEMILNAKDRQAASTSVPPHGLFLWKVSYPQTTISV